MEELIKIIIEEIVDVLQGNARIEISVDKKIL
jgi:hypothetical protein